MSIRVWGRHAEEIVACCDSSADLMFLLTDATLQYKKSKNK